MHITFRRLALAIAATGALAFAAPAAASAATAAPAAASAPGSVIGDPGVYLANTPTLTLAAPNKVTTGKAAVLKTCLGNGNCAVTANLKTTETFDFVASTTATTGTMMRLHGTNWCVTNRGTAVFFEACQSFASQLWNGSGGVLTGVLTNAKTGLRLTHTAVAAYAPVQVSSQFTFWGNSS